MTGDVTKPSDKDFQRLKAHVAYKPPLVDDGGEYVIYGVFDSEGNYRNASQLREPGDEPECPGVIVEVRSLMDHVSEFEERWMMSNRQ